MKSQELIDCVLSKRKFVGYCCNLTEKIFQGFLPTSKCKVCLPIWNRVRPKFFDQVGHETMYEMEFFH
jgi:hypothetical protein